MKKYAGDWVSNITTVYGLNHHLVRRNVKLLVINHEEKNNTYLS
jgi:hypothetical protein